MIVRTANMNFLKAFIYFIVFGIIGLLPDEASAQQENISSKLEKDFRNPPDRTKPRTWMHAMSSNMSKKGLTKDLEAIQQVGIGGVLLFSVTHTIPQGKVLFNSKEHQDMIAYAAKECERLGLSFGVHNCDGWTSSGGPWVTPDNSMKMVVWNETLVKGGNMIDVKLPTPTARRGFYKDVAVIAYPSINEEIKDTANKPKVTSSDPNLDISIITDGKWDHHSMLNSSEEKSTQNWIQFDFSKPYSVRSLHLALTKSIKGSRKVSFQQSDDGQNFKEINIFNLKRLGKKEFAVDETFPEIKAQYFRVIPEDNFNVMEASLTSRPNYDNYLAKTSLFKIENHRLQPIEVSNPDRIINKNDIINLTGDMNALGNLKTKLPKGNWTIMRFGFTSTGAVNTPASDTGRGLEVDKMSKEALNIHYDAYVGKVVANTKDIAPNALQYLEIDSFEVGGQNWTEKYQEIFKNTYGYDLVSFLPLYAGRIVENAKASDAVLWDIRKLNSDLITNNYFGYFTELTHQDGLISYIEPYSFNAPFNELDAGKHTDIPMGEFWMHQRYQHETAVSSARIYGKKIVSAESFSARPEINWQGHPGMIKSTGDKAWTLGINEFMFHRFAHQANTHVLPGMTMSQWGSHIDRTQTWWNNAGAAWFKYIARGSTLLRKGNPVSDVLVYVGEGSPNSITKRHGFKPKLPLSINYDNVNTDVLLNRIIVEDGKLVLPEGTAYKMLLLRDINKITLKTLQRIADLADQGITIVGKKPLELAGYQITEVHKKQFDSLVPAIWNKKTTYLPMQWPKLYSSGNWTYDMEVIDKEVGYIHRKSSKEDIYFFANTDSIAQTLHCKFRITGKIPEFWDPMTGGIKQLAYFRETDNQTHVSLYLHPAQSAFIIFRKSSEKINPITDFQTDTGIFPLLHFNQNEEIIGDFVINGTYTLQLKDQKTQKIEISEIPEEKTINTPWTIDFDAPYGYQKTLKTDTLFGWTTSNDFEIKHFSGTATYTNSFEIASNDLKKDNKILLDLGEVHIAAKVLINEQQVATLWIPPFSIDITKYVKKGKNQLTIEVTNTWTNRLIGDEHYPRTDGYNVTKAGGAPPKMPDWYIKNQPMPKGQRKTFAAFPFYTKNDPLMSSGLIGPIKFKFLKTVSLQQ